MSLKRSKIAENAKLEFAILFGEISANRSTPMFFRSQINEFILKLPKDIGNSIFRFRANRGPFVVESDLYFLAVSKKPIFIVRNRILGGYEEARKSRILNSSRVL